MIINHRKKVIIVAEGDLNYDEKFDPDTRQRLLERNLWQIVEDNDQRFPDTEGGDPTSPEDDADGDGSGEGEGGDENETPQEKMVKDDLKVELDKRGVKYTSRASHQELVDLLKEAQSTED